MNLKKFYLEHCEVKQYEINQNQLKIINDLNEYYSENFNQTFLSNFLKKKSSKLGFYLVGDVGIGKTMILNFFFNQISKKKNKTPF